MGRLFLPVGLLVVGVMGIRGEPHPGSGRSLAGLGVALIAISSLAGLAGGSPGMAASLPTLRGAGGWLGALIGRPLGQFLAPSGAAIVSSTVLLVSLVYLAGRNIREVYEGGAIVAGALGRAAARAVEAARVHSEAAGATEVEDAEETVPFEAAPGIGSLDLYDAAAYDGDEDVYDEQGDAVDGEQGEEEEYEEGDDDVFDEDVENYEDEEEGEGEQLDLELDAAEVDWELPPRSLLTRSRSRSVDKRQVDAGGRALVDALATHGVATQLLGRTIGPTVTRYELELGPGVKVARVTSLAKDIAYAMASPDVRILAPIPGRSAIGVEVPNRQRQLVTLADVLASDEASEAIHPLEVAMGRDIAGRAVMVNLAEMPHLLIAGATGAGKSSCINSLVTSVLMRSTPEEVRLILVDPKRVELGQYNGLPHLLTQVVVNPRRAANALAWAVQEMERRYDLLAEAGVRDITGYNEAFDSEDLPGQGDSLDDDVEEPVPLPFILVVVDELNDLMMVAARDVEDSICRIAQMARAVGIHLVIATQRPSVDVITGVIKANIPARLAFSVSSLADSRVILDQPGAERLVGQGDMLLLAASSSVPLRLQGPWVGEDEVRSVVGHWHDQSDPQYVDGVEEGESSEASEGGI
ncbi:MAG: DNA translocase FtsK 4TM domain-containing protein, partial [Acidimicrobiales bacterium]